MSVVSFASEVDKHVGQKIRNRRETLKISQGRLGRQLGVSFSQVQKYEKGSNRIGAGRLYQISAFLGVSPNYFYEGLDEGPSLATDPDVRHTTINPDELQRLGDSYSTIADEDLRTALIAFVASLTTAETRGPVAR